MESIIELVVNGSRRFILKNSQFYSIYIYRAATSTFKRKKVIPENTSPSNTASIFSREGGKGESTAEGKLTWTAATAKKMFQCCCIFLHHKSTLITLFWHHLEDYSKSYLLWESICPALEAGMGREAEIEKEILKPLFERNKGSLEPQFVCWEWTEELHSSLLTSEAVIRRNEDSQYNCLSKSLSLCDIERIWD